ncbi:gamma-glutamylcyclotransferase family protein [Nocardia sp. NPDC127606]|uniref:gamma-glutamylcyclotransferase family protein n=1 Tax=Nocardia sp. NPDC127606 TaxID=3345406 RepID=UPI003639E497
MPVTARVHVGRTDIFGPEGLASTSTAPLFAYGTLQVPEVAQTLIGRVPDTRTGELNGWVAAPLPGRMYPGLVRDKTRRTPGLVVTGLTAAEWMLFDRFEDEDYALERVTLTDGTDAWAYVWQLDTDPGVWSMSDFRSNFLPQYVDRCAAWSERDTKHRSIPR